MSLVSSLSVQKRNLNIHTALHRPGIPDNKFTVLIGPNGSGKSRFLNAYVSLSSYGDDDRKNHTRFDSPYSANSAGKYPVDDLRIIAYSNSPTDNFSTTNRKRTKKTRGAEYFYIGTKSKSRSFRQNLATLIGDISIALKKDQSKQNQYGQLLKDLGFEPRIFLRLSSKILKVVASKYTRSTGEYEKFDGAELLKILLEENTKLKFKPAQKEAVIKFLDNIKYDWNSENLDFEYELDFDNLFKSNDLSENLEAILALKKTKILSVSDIVAFKYGNQYGFDLSGSSSGESVMLYFFFGLIYYLQEKTVILIDEPEVSLHPNWQTEYIEILKKIVTPYSEYQCIIATHSPQIVANCPQEETTVLRLQQIDGAIHTSYIPPEDSGWSVESILYNVFGCREAGNKYFERDLGKILSLISDKSTDKKEIHRLIGTLKRLKLKSDDPVNLIIKEAEEYGGKI